VVTVAAALGLVLLGGTLALGVLLAANLGHGSHTASAAFGDGSAEFHIDVTGVAGCTTGTGAPKPTPPPTPDAKGTCNIAFPSTFTVNAYIDRIGAASYPAFAVTLTYAGAVTAKPVSNVSPFNPDVASWPNCVFAARTSGPGSINAGCVIGIPPAPNSTYVGKVFSAKFDCTQAGTGTITMKHGSPSDTLIAIDTIVAHTDKGPDVLNINCSATTTPGNTPTFTPMPTPTPGQLDFSIGIGSQCDSDSPSTATCNITGSQYFTLDFKLNDKQSGYLGYDSLIQYSGVTVAQSSLATQGPGAWPDCAYTGKSFSDGEVAVGCAVPGSSPSYYTGPMWRIGYQCPFNPGGPANITLVNRGTDVVGTDLVGYTEPGGDETLVINCPQTAYSQSITASSGGTLQTAFGDTLSVPPGALPSDTTVTLDTEPILTAQPVAVVPLPRAYNFGPAGLTFLIPATAVLSYTDSDLGSADPSSLRVYFFNTQTNSWDLLGGTVDTVAKTLTIELNHFSTYELLRDGNVDTDGDGCTDTREVGTNAATGGRRDWQNPWDYFNPTHDGRVRSDDILAVQQHYGRNAGDPGYDVKYDRTYIGPNVWNLGPPDGKIRSVDILAIQKQYGHDCA
jgi:hypothetical protein